MLGELGATSAWDTWVLEGGKGRLDVEGEQDLGAGIEGSQDGQAGCTVTLCLQYHRAKKEFEEGHEETAREGGGHGSEEDLSATLHCSSHSLGRRGRGGCSVSTRSRCGMCGR